MWVRSRSKRQPKSGARSPASCAGRAGAVGALRPRIDARMALRSERLRPRSCGNDHVGLGQRRSEDCAGGCARRGLRRVREPPTAPHVEQQAMRAPTPSLPSGLPGRTAITIIGCLVVALAALWFYILTRNMIAIGVGALALVIAGLCASTYRWVE